MARDTMSVEDVCEYVETYVQDKKISQRIVGMLRAGHECRNALLELCPDSSFAEDKIDEYDKFWLYD